MNIPEKAWKIASVVGVLLAIFLAAVSIKEFKSIGYVGKSEQILNSISVNGKGEIVAIPDVATFSFTVSETAKTVDEAQSKSTTKTNATLQAVRDAGVAANDIKTLSYSINPHYEYQSSVCPAASYGVQYCPPGKSILTGYEVSQSIEVKVRDLKKAGSIFTSIGALNVQNVNGLNFSVDDMDAVKDQARALAIKNAQAKAKELSKQLGVRIVRITSFYENSDYPAPYYSARGGDGLVKEQVANVAPEVPTGEQKIMSNVVITYEIR